LGAKRLFITGFAEGFNEGSFGTLAIGSEIAFTKFVDLGSGAIDIGLLLGEIDLHAILSVEETIKADSGGESGLKKTSRLLGIALEMTLLEILTEDISLPLIRVLVDEFI